MGDRASNRTYLAGHPELKVFVTSMVAALISRRPDDPQSYISEWVRTPGLCDHIARQVGAGSWIDLLKQRGVYVDPEPEPEPTPEPSVPESEGEATEEISEASSDEVALSRSGSRGPSRPGSRPGSRSMRRGKSMGAIARRGSTLFGTESTGSMSRRGSTLLGSDNGNSGWMRSLSLPCVRDSGRVVMEQLSNSLKYKDTNTPFFCLVPDLATMAYSAPLAVARLAASLALLGGGVFTQKDHVDDHECEDAVPLIHVQAGNLLCPYPSPTIIGGDTGSGDWDDTATLGCIEHMAALAPCISGIGYMELCYGLKGVVDMWPDTLFVASNLRSSRVAMSMAMEKEGRRRWGVPEAPPWQEGDDDNADKSLKPSASATSLDLGVDEIPLSSKWVGGDDCVALLGCENVNPNIPNVYHFLPVLHRKSATVTVVLSLLSPDIPAIDTTTMPDYSGNVTAPTGESIGGTNEFCQVDPTGGDVFEITRRALLGTVTMLSRLGLEVKDFGVLFLSDNVIPADVIADIQFLRPSLTMGVHVLGRYSALSRRSRFYMIESGHYTKAEQLAMHALSDLRVCEAFERGIDMHHKSRFPFPPFLAPYSAKGDVTEGERDGAPCEFRSSGLRTPSFVVDTYSDTPLSTTNDPDVSSPYMVVAIPTIRASDSDDALDDVNTLIPAQRVQYPSLPLGPLTPLITSVLRAHINRTPGDLHVPQLKVDPGCAPFHCDFMAPSSLMARTTTPPLPTLLTHLCHQAGQRVVPSFAPAPFETPATPALGKRRANRGARAKVSVESAFSEEEEEEREKEKDKMRIPTFVTCLSQTMLLKDSMFGPLYQAVVRHHPHECEYVNPSLKEAIDYEGTQPTVCDGRDIRRHRVHVPADTTARSFRETFPGCFSPDAALFFGRTSLARLLTALVSILKRRLSTKTQGMVTPTLPDTPLLAGVGLVFDCANPDKSYLYNLTRMGQELFLKVQDTNAAGASSDGPMPSEIDTVAALAEEYRIHTFTCIYRLL
ncbi:hypothetical protein KIPB_003179 [Kipferlia bialata]|uniref:Uncharacterized protein n=1 Tax=Kipferlia bialata TaxID=797122 RepID=A0A9K3CSI4_9EUKA|nr:hypothetical protein KIPB_003179 [Kipferlia bialata]|eukprot:g3179.t1